MLTSSRLLFLGGTLVCAAALTYCGNTPSNNTTMDMSGGPDLAMVTSTSLSLTSVSPTNAINNAGATMTLIGTNFQAGATVTIGGVAATNVTVVSSTQITCKIPVKAATCGLAAITVSNPDGKMVSSPNLFTFQSTALAFATPVPLTMAKTPRYVIAVDLDGKNGLDLVTANSGAGNLAVRLNNGTGSFATPTLVDLGGNSPFAVAAAYVDADTKIDLLTVLKAGSSVKVRLGVGDGTFTAPTIDTGFSVGASPVDIAVGDLNGDGKVDALVANNGSNNLSTLLGNGDGTFQAQKTTTVGTSSTAVILANFNNDGKLDFASTDSIQATIKLNAANGTGAFGVGSLIAGLTSPSDLAFGDFNGDGINDLVVANGGVSTVRVSIGVGDSTFTAGATPTAGTTSVTTRSVVTGDFNLDGFLDIAVTNEADHNVSILLGNGKNGIGTFQTKVDFTLGTTADPTQLAVGDLNGDGIPDLVSTDESNNGVVVLLSQCQ